jgi:hypothetical protein
MLTEELEFENETRKHQQEVSRLLIQFSQLLLTRAMYHDESKLEHPERESFIQATAILKGLTYGSEEYKESLKKLGPALEHHYLTNKHHPEFNDLNGFSLQTLNDPIRSMDLVDMVEMLCDWIAATKRHTDGNIGRSITINEKRFGINEQLSQVFRNTSGLLSRVGV